MLVSWRLLSVSTTDCLHLHPSVLRLKQLAVLVFVVFALYTLSIDQETFRRTWASKLKAGPACSTIHLPPPIEATAGSKVWQDLTELFDAHKPSPALERPVEFTIKDAKIVTDPYTISHALGLDPKDVEASRETHAALVSTLPAYPKNLYSGRGIVVVGGGNYSEFAATSLGMLRHAGSELPVELWMKNDMEAQPEWCSELAQEGVACRLLSDYMDVSCLGGYQLKPAAMLLSTFQEILYLDADNNAIRNPDTLFDTEEYQETGAILWPDFWRSTESPMTGYIIGASNDMVTTDVSTIQTVESGQMLWNKRRHWKTLCLSTYYNYHGPSYYYTLITQGGPGWGDKDTFATALRSLNAPWHLVPEPVRSLWENRPNGLPIAMVQADPRPPSPSSRSSAAPTASTVINPTRGTETKPNAPGSLEDWSSFTPLFLHANWKKWGVRSFMCDVCPAIPSSTRNPQHFTHSNTPTSDHTDPPSPQITGRFSTATDPLSPLLNNNQRILRLKDVPAWQPGFNQSQWLRGWNRDPESDMWGVMARVACQGFWRDEVACARTREYVRMTFGVEVVEGEEGEGDRGSCGM